jgi:hypothetical protein
MSALCALLRRLSKIAGFAVLLLVLPGEVCGQNAPHLEGYRYLSPVPGASYVSQQTRYVLVRFEQVTPMAITNLLTDFITVDSSKSGNHSGTTRVATDGRTVIFQIRDDFLTNELVTVTLNPQMAQDAAAPVAPYQYQFMVTAPMPGSVPLTETAVTSAKISPPQIDQEQNPRSMVDSSPGRNITPHRPMVSANGVSVPSDFPRVTISVNNNPSPGCLFLENALDGVTPYTMLLNNQGLPVWYRRGRMSDFKNQKNGMITWCVQDAAGVGTFYEADQNLNVMQTYVATNGYSTDGHDFKVLPDGRYFLIGFRNNSVNLGQYIANRGMVVVTETVVQGFTAAGELIFQWRSWDNYDIRNQVPLGNTDLAHMNGIDIDEDGNVLVSSRHLSEVTKINIDSGDIIWRLGGAHNSFAFVNDPLNGTSYQHNISVLGNGHYMVFDNGDYHVPTVSRAVEYQLNLTNMTATMVWQFRDNPDKYTFWMGNAQRLASGNTFIDFVLAQYPKAIEVDTNGVKHFELSLVPGSTSYRAFRFPWNGAVAAPYLILEPQPANVTLLFNKFGDTNVDYYRIYGGPEPHPTTILAESAVTMKQLSNVQNGLYYFRVTAVNQDGMESPFSNEESLNVNLPLAGVNTVSNGDFSQGTNRWTVSLSGGAAASWNANDAIGTFNITNGGPALSSVQLAQGSHSLIQSNTYIIEFDAWASQSRYIGVQVAQTTTPFADYSQIQDPFLTPNHNHYRYAFTMKQPSDFSAKLLFNLGGSAASVYLDNISLTGVAPGDLNLDGRVDFLDLSGFSENWLKQQNGLPGDLNADGKIDFNDFNILGANWTGIAGTAQNVSKNLQPPPIPHQSRLPNGTGREQ